MFQVLGFGSFKYHLIIALSMQYDLHEIIAMCGPKYNSPSLVVPLILLKLKSNIYIIVKSRLHFPQSQDMEVMVYL